MIKTTLPIIVKSIDEEKKSLVVTKKDITVKVDTSVFAEERWEQHFPHNAEKETIFAYTERVHKQGNKESVAWVLSALKAIYCFMESDELSTFKEFCQIFDLAEDDYLPKLVEKIKFVFEIALSSSTASGKN